MSELRSWPATPATGGHLRGACRSLLLAWALCMTAGCSSGSRDQQPPPATAAGALASTPGAAAAEPSHRLPDLGGSRLLDVEGDRVLAGLPDDAPPNADPVMRMDVRLFVGGQRAPWPAAAQPAAHARLLPGGRALAVTPRGALLLVEGDVARPLDVDVVGPIGASPDGTLLVYCKGEAPDLDVWRLDLGAGATPARVATDLAPAWSPAIAPDGSVVVASARSGFPALWRIEAGGTPVQLTNRDVTASVGVPPVLSPFPASLTPTLFDGERVVFEGEAGVVVADRDGRVLRQTPGASVPHWRAGRRAGVLAGAHVVDLDLERGAP